jgi:outer membrane protein insertion porin family
MNSFAVFARRLAFSLLLLGAGPIVTGIVGLVTADQAAAAVASSIQVVGNQRVDADTVKTYIVIKVGKPYGASEIDESIKILYGTGLFSDVGIGQRGSVLVVTIVENPVVNAVLFQGNKKVKSNILEQLVDLKPRGVLTDARLQSDIQRIKDYYARSGRSGAAVDAQIAQLPNNRVNVTFVIVEGGLTGVGSITFVGNQAFPSSRLSRIIQTRTTNWLSWLNKRNVYSEERLQADQEALRKFYLEHGFADFQILGADAVFDEAKGRWHLTFTVDEGPKYKFGEIAIDSSIEGVDANQLMKVVKTKTGRTFNSRDVELSTENLTIELSRLGYVFAQVRPRGDRDYTNNVISITYVIDEGARAYVERIDIRGNTKTRDYVIRREFDISEGDAYNRVLVNRAERRLRDLGYFSTVQISTEPGSAPDKVVLVVFVQDKSTGSFSVSAGVSTTDGLIGEIALEETNFLGRGQTLRISVGGGFSGDQTYNLSFTDPYFLGTRISGGFDAYRTTSKSGSSRPFETETIGGGVRLGFKLSDELDAQLNYKIANATISGAAPCAPPLTVTECYFPNGSRLTSSAGYVLTYSNLDSKLDPHDGLYMRLSQDFAGIGGDARYMRTVGDARLYKPILPDSDIVGMLKVTGGNILGFGGPVATADNFFKGGETIRGFAPLGFGPRDTTLGPTGGLAVGGKNFIAGTAEVTFPMPMLPPDFGLRGAVFADAGMLFGADVPSCPAPGCTVVDDAAIRSSVGASILWASPFGSIRLDFAQALTKASYDKTQFFRLGAGTQF